MNNKTLAKIVEDEILNNLDTTNSYLLELWSCTHSLQHSIENGNMEKMLVSAEKLDDALTVFIQYIQSL